MIRFKKIVAQAVIVLVAYSPFGNASEMALPGIPTSGSPNFTNAAVVKMIELGGKFSLVASNSGAITFIDSAKNVSVSTTGAANFSLYAQFLSDGTYVPDSGTVSISGTLPYPYVPNATFSITGDLLTAKLEKFAFDADTLGFSTKMLSGYGALFGQSESVYLYAPGLGTDLGFGESLNEMLSPISVTAVTTVPLPGAGWLLGSALGIFTLVRRNRQNLESSC